MSGIPSVLRQLPRLAESTTIRNFSIAARRMAEGDAGAPRSGGSAQSDAFNKREKANEDMYMKQQEKKKLEELRRKIAEKEADVAKDRKEAEKLMKK